jgi:hypothetical protein
MAEVNPYRPPAAHVEDVSAPAADGRSFIAGGRRVAAGHGWTWIKEGWGLFKQQPGAWLLIVLLAWVISIAASLVPLLGFILPSLIFPGLFAGIILGCKALDEGNRLTVAHLFSAFQVRGGALLLLGLAEFVLALVAMIPFLVVFGTGVAGAMMSGNPAALADIGPGVQIAFLVSLALILPVFAAGWFAAALVTLHDMSPLAALWTGFVAFLKNIVPFLLNGFIFLLLGILAVIPLGLGLLVLVPVFFATDYTSYRDIFFEG